MDENVNEMPDGGSTSTHKLRKTLGRAALVVVAGVAAGAIYAKTFGSNKTESE